MLIAGTDEAGRGPLAGPVVAAAVILDPGKPIDGLNDSKKLTPKKRQAFYIEIQQKALSFCIATASIEEIEDLNILSASMLAMQRSVEGLNIQPAQLLVDGNRCPAVNMPAQAIIGGDAVEPCISAASILAKVYRDQLMQDMQKIYPEYGFAQHKGYPTVKHMQALQLHGPCAIHRKTYAPVKKLLNASSHFQK